MNADRYEIEHRICVGNSVKWVHERAEFELDANGRRIRAVGTVRDITAEKLAEARQRRMMAELDHRVKNNLTAILSLSEQTAVTSKGDLDGYTERFSARVRAMAAVHEALASNRWVSVDLGAIVRLVVGQVSAENVIDIQGDEVMLPADAAMPVCLSIHELAMNAAKHGALKQPGGRIEICWSKKDDQSIDFVWREYCQVEIPAPQTSGLGLHLIGGFIKFELGGSADIDIQPDGLRCRLRFSSEDQHGGDRVQADPKVVSAMMGRSSGATRGAGD